MRAQARLSSMAAVLSGLLALASASPAQAQGKAEPAKPAAAAPAKAAAAAPAKAAAAAPDKAAKPAAAAAPAKPLNEKQKKDQARKLYKDAEDKFKANAFAEALDLYKQAEDLVPVHATKYKIAVSLDKLNRPVDAVVAYQLFLDSKPDPDKMKDAVAEATARVDTLKKTPGKVRLTTEPSNPPNLKVVIDGAPAQGVSPGAGGGTDPAAAPTLTPRNALDFSVPPGHHKIDATADGFDPSSQEVDVSFAETKDVKLTLNATPPPPPPPVAQVVAPPPPVAPPQPPPPPPRSNIPAYVTLGLAGAGAIVGTIFGVSALGAKSEFNTKPTVDNADKADRNALIADMSFAVALTFGVTGAVLLLTNDPAPEPPKAALNGTPQKKTAKSMPRGFVAPFVSPTSGGAAAFLKF
jgi:hypothetical protein